MAKIKITVNMTNCEAYHGEIVNEVSIDKLGTYLPFTCDQFKDNGSGGSNVTEAYVYKKLPLNKICHAHCQNASCERLRV